jgi:hypothetical protein
MFWEAMLILICVCAFAYIISDLSFAIRDKIYQKKWDQEKAMRMRAKPAISRAELCEYYVMFCLRNDCKVKY